MSSSKIGFHYAVGGNKNGIGELITALNQNNIPILMKGVDDAGLCYQIQSNPINHPIYRVSTAGQGGAIQYDVPDYTKSPKIAAHEHFNKTAAKWPQELDKTRVWMEPINEPRAKLNPGDIQYNNMNPVNWLGEFMLEYAKIANVNGFKVCGPSFNSGEPEVFSVNEYEQPGMLAYLQYCVINPTQAALSVHEYIWDGWQSNNEDWLDWYPELWGRVEAVFAAADKHKISRNFQVFVTEWGFGQYEAPTWPECEKYLTLYNQWAARWPQIKGVATWTLQAGWGDISNDLQTWFNPLITYALTKTFDPGLQPTKTHIKFGGTLPNMTITIPAKIKHTIHLLPQSTTLNELNQVTAELHPTRSAFTYSADVAHAILYAGNSDSKVVIWDAARWAGGKVAITKWFTDRGVLTSQIEYRNFGGSSLPFPFLVGRLRLAIG